MQINPEALRTLREHTGYTITALANAAGIQRPHLSNIEAGRRNPSPPVALALANALNVNLSAITTHENGHTA